MRPDRWPDLRRHPHPPAGNREAVKALPDDLLATQPSIPWRQIAHMRDYLAHRYFDTAHAILQATVDEDLPDLERAVQALTRSMKKEDPHTRPGAT